MKLDLIALTSKIIFIEFPSRLSMIKHLLRFQEFIEHPVFRSKVFTVCEYKIWNQENWGDGGLPSDWLGCNIPAAGFKPFFDGHFSPLSKGEMAILKLLQPYRNKKFYLIATAKQKKNDSDNFSALKHEVAHALFYADLKYRKEAKQVLHQFQNQTYEFMKKRLRDLQCTDRVIEDEMQAYLLDGITYFKYITGRRREYTPPITADFKLASKKIATLFKEAVVRNGIKIEGRTLT